MLCAKNKAFTLVELLVVIAIIGLLSTIILVSIKSMGDKARIANGLRFSQQIHNRLGVDAIGIWNFDEGSGTTVYDSSGYNHDGTINGATYKNDTPSGKGYALKFNGTNQYIETNIIDNIFFYNGFTGSVWINLDALEAGNIHKGIISKASGVQGDNGFVLVYGAFNYQKKILFKLNSSSDNIISDDFLKPNTWFHVVFVVEPGNPNATVTFYVDGKVSGNKKQNLGSSIDIITTDNSLEIGRRYSSNYYFQGLMDDVRIYAAPLALSQIETLYYTGLNNLLVKGLMSKEEYRDKLTNL